VRWVVIALACWTRTATAQAPSATPAATPAYPLEHTDRPLVLFPGMTTLDLSLDMPQYSTTSVDAMGNTTTTKHFHHLLDLTIEHAFGSMQIGARAVDNTAGPYFYVSGETMVGTGAVYVDLYAEVPTPNSPVGHNYGQFFGYVYKALVAPKRLALLAGASVVISELQLTPAMQPASSGYESNFNVGGEVDVQLTSRLAFRLGPSVGVPIGHSASLPTPRVYLNVDSSVLVALGHWDLYGQFFVEDVTHDVYVFFAVGFVHRWGG
jgi:hypothetical protein